MIIWNNIFLLAQDYASQFGHALDANPRVGSYGLNTDARLDLIIPRGNFLITGNVGGGQSFQGMVPYRSTAEFQGTLSNPLSSFQRDSIGVENLSRPIGASQYYFDPSRQITGTYGQAVVNTANLGNYLNVTPVGRSLTLPSNATNLTARPFSQSMHPFVNIQSQIPPYSPMSNIPAATPQAPWMVEPSLNRSPSVSYQPREPNLPSQAAPFDQQLFNQPQTTFPTEEHMPSTSPESAVDFYLQFQRELQHQREQTQFSPLDKQAETEKTAASKNTPFPESSFPLDKSLPVVSPDRMSSNRPEISAAGQTGQEFRQEQFNQYMKLGTQYLHDGRYYLAADIFDTAAVYLPGDPTPVLAKAHALFAAGEYMSSAYFLNKALVCSPELAGTIKNPQAIFSSPEEFNKRLEDLIHWQSISSRSELLFLLGYIQMQIGDFAKAENSFNTILTTQPLPQSDILKSVNLFLDILKTKNVSTPQ